MKRTDQTGLPSKHVQFSWAQPRSGILLPLVMIAAVTAILTVIYYILFPGRGYFHSDCTDTLYWAQASYDSGRLISRDFFYASLLPFGGSLLMLPWIGLFGVSMTTHIIGMLLFVVLFIAATVFLLRTLNWNATWIASLLAVLLSLLLISDKAREMFWGHIIYYSLDILFLFVGLALVLRTWRYSGLDGQPFNARRFQRYCILLFIWFLLCATDGLQTVMVVAVPVMLALFSQWFFRCQIGSVQDVDQKSPTRDEGYANNLALLILLASLVGMALGLLLADGVQARYENGYTSFSASSQWFANLSSLPQHWASLLGVETRRSESFISAAGFLDLIKLGACLVTWAIPLLMLLLYRKIKDKAIRILVLTHWGMAAVILFAYVFGSLATASWRLLPIVVSSIFLCIVFAKWISEQTGTWRFLVLTVMPLALAGVVGLATVARMPPDFGRNQGLYTLKDFLLEQDLTYGYATFWNANALTVIASSQVKARNIAINEMLITPYNYQSEHSWFDDQPGQDRYFLLLTSLEYKKWSALEPPFAAKAMEKLEFGDYVILVFDENIFPEASNPEVTGAAGGTTPQQPG